MALPSQMDRSTEMGRSTSPRAGGKGTGPGMMWAGVGIAVVAIGAVVWGLTKLGGTGKPGTTPQTQTAGLTADPPKPHGTPPTSVGHLGKSDGASPSEPPPVTFAPSPTTTPASGAPTGTPGTPPETPGKPTPVDLSSPGAVPAKTTESATNPAPLAPPSASPATTPPASIPASGSTTDVRSLIEGGDQAMIKGNQVQARLMYSRAFLSPSAGNSDKASLRDKLSKINEEMVFGAKVTPGDPLAEAYKVESGDNLVKIARKRQLAADWRLIQRVNKLTSPNTLHVGQNLKLVRGPFHAIVSKGEYRLDLFAGSPDEPESWLYIRSFKVGLGAEDSSTPLGTFTVKKGSKLVNPHWVNPRTGEKFEANDPKNPICEHWIGLEGTGSSAAYKGYGLHGTIEPNSIGQQRSMGCVRMGAEDVAMMYELLAEQISVVKIVP